MTGDQPNDRMEDQPVDGPGGAEDGGGASSQGAPGKEDAEAQAPSDSEHGGRGVSDSNERADDVARVVEPD